MAAAAPEKHFSAALRSRTIAHAMREAQLAKIAEIKKALLSCGISNLDQQAEVLGIKRGTA